MKKIVYVSQRVEFVKSHQETRDCIDQNLISFLQHLDLLSIPIPNFKTNIKKSIDFIFKKLPPSAIVLSGGNDIGEYKNRDISEYYMIDLAIANNIPLIGICRGMQIINSYFGGSSVKVDNHVNINHNIFDLFDNKVMVNSYHNYGIKNTPNCLEVKYYSEDGTIEGFKHINKSIYGIMWHPERQSPFKTFDINFFKSILIDKK